jgi:hypothetical protein
MNVLIAGFREPIQADIENGLKSRGHAVMYPLPTQRGQIFLPPPRGDSPYDVLAIGDGLVALTAIQVLRLVRKHKNFVGLPIVLYTSKHAPGLALEINRLKAVYLNSNASDPFEIVENLENAIRIAG